MNLAKKLLVCALIFSSITNAVAATADDIQAPRLDVQTPGFFETWFTNKDWYQGQEIKPVAVAKTLAAYAVVAGAVSFVAYEIAQIAKERKEEAEAIAFLKPKFEKFVTNYQQLMAQALQLAQSALDGGPQPKTSLYTLLLEQKKQNGYELIDIMSEKIGADVGAVIERLVKEFDGVVNIPAENQKERLMAALTNLGAFMDWVFTGQFNVVQIPVAEPVRHEPATSHQATNKQPAKKEKSARASSRRK